MPDAEIISGDERLSDLGNDVSDAVHRALDRGLSGDVICSVMVAVIADYWISLYAKPCTVLCNIFRDKERFKRRPAGGRA